MIMELIWIKSRVQSRIHQYITSPTHYNTRKRRCIEGEEYKKDEEEDPHPQELSPALNSNTFNIVHRNILYLLLYEMKLAFYPYTYTLSYHYNYYYSPTHLLVVNLFIIISTLLYLIVEILSFIIPTNDDKSNEESFTSI